MADELTLLPCPWCGNKEVYWTHSSDGDGGSAYVYCSDCDACGPQGKAYTKDGFSDEADQRWNTRVPDPALAAKDQRIAELEDEIAALKRRNTEIEDRLQGYGFAVDSVREKARVWHPDILRFPGATVIEWLHRRANNLEAENARLKAGLAAAQEALRLSGIGGIYDDFASLDDAITQMATHIRELEARVAANSATPHGSCGWCAHSGGWRERWSPFGEVQQYGTCLHPARAGIAVLGDLSCDLFERKEDS